MRAGCLRHSITIMIPWSETVSPTGDVRPMDSGAVTVRAEIVKQSASEFLTGMGTADARTVVFRIRHVPGLATGFRIMHDGVFYDLKEIVEIENGRGLELRAVAAS